MTQLKAAQNTTDEKPDEFALKIEEILELRSSPDVDTILMKKKIFDVLHDDKQKAFFLLKTDSELYQYLPEKLKSDEDVLRLVITKDPGKYKMLDIKHRRNQSLQETAISGIITGGGDVLDLIEVLKLSKKGNKKLQTLVNQLLEKHPNFLKDTQSQLIYAVFTSERKTFDIFTEKGLISSSHSGISLGSRAAACLAKILPELEGKSPEETQSKLFSAVLEFFGLAENKLGESSRKLIELLIHGISLSPQSGILSPSEEKGAADDEDNQQNKNQEEDEDDDADIYASVGPYNYIPLGNSCRVWDNGGSSVVIEKKEFENMNEKSLDNFMIFSKLMKHLGLDFLISKQHRLSQLVTDVNFYDGEGMSEGRILKFLNSVGKNIGVPEQSYQDSEGNKKTGYFKTLGAAKMHFGEVRDSGKIGGLDIDVSNKGDKSIVEIYMKHCGLLVEPFGEISVARWS